MSERELLTVKALREKLKAFDEDAKILVVNAATSQTFGFEETDIFLLPPEPAAPKKIGFRTIEDTNKERTAKNIICIKI